MKAHKTGTIDSGFILGEKGLRRIIDTAKEQLNKAGAEEIYQEYEVKYENGVIEKFPVIQEVLDLDNIGSSKICSLSLKLGIANQDSTIELTFSNPNEEKKSDSIYYSITGVDRDWLFVTISQIEERISPVERSKRWVLEAKFSDLIMVFAMGLMITFYYVFVSMTYGDRVYSFDYEKTWKDFVEVEYSVSDELKKLSVSSPDLKPIEVFYEYQLLLAREDDIRSEAVTKHEQAAQQWVREQRNSKLEDEYKLVIMLMGGFIPAFLLYFYTKLVRSIFPLYVFCWGDSKDRFSRLESTRKILLVGVCLSFVVSVFAGLFVNLI